jgi:CRP-like cAMP-binding protein
MPTFDILRREADIRSFKQGETNFKAGDPGDCMFVVVEGAVKIDLAGTVVERLAPGGLSRTSAVI